MSNPDHMSIFGDTYEGVPSPTIPHVHPYPTRYHGPIWTVPRFDKPYQENPYARSPYAGLGSGCACKGLGGSPDGLGMLVHAEHLPGGPRGFGEPVLCASTGSSLVDAAVGAAIGAVVAKKAEDRIAWALAGAAAGWLGGVVGMLGIGAAGLYMRQK